jgi:hypothetical protein
MRRGILVLIAVVVVGCQSTGSPPMSGDQSSIPSGSEVSPGNTYLGMLDQNKIYPITGTAHVRISSFSTAQFFYQATALASDGQQSSHGTETATGSIDCRPDGDGFALTLVVVEDQTQSDQPSFQGTLSKFKGVKTRVVLSPFGVVKDISMPEAGIDPGSPVARAALASLSPYYRDAMQLPEQGIQQDQRIGQADQVPDPHQSVLVVAEKGRTLVAQGQGVYKGKPVIVFSYTGQLFETWDSQNRKIGDTEGFTLLDQITGIALYSEKNGSFEAPEEGQPGRKIKTKAHAIYEVNF